MNVSVFKYAYEKQKAQGRLIILGWAGGQKEGLQTDRWEETGAVLSLLSPEGPMERSTWRLMLPGRHVPL